MDENLIVSLRLQDALHKFTQQEIFGNDTYAILFNFVGDNDVSSGAENNQQFEYMERNILVIPEDYRWHMLSWHVHPQSFIYEPLQKFILECHQHGFIINLMNNLFTTLVKPEAEGPQVLTMFILSAGFYIWLCTVLIAIVVFFIEHLLFYLSKQRVKIKEVNRKKTKKLKKLQILEDLRILKGKENSKNGSEK